MTGPGIDVVPRCLAAAADGWLRGDWDGQEELIRHIATATGFHPNVVFAGIADHFIPMSLANVRHWRDTRCGSEHADHSLPPAARRVAILPAGNIPGVALIPAMAVLLAGGDVLVKTSRDEPRLMNAWRDRLARFDPSMAERVTVESWAGAEPGGLDRVDGCDRIIVLGSNETLERLAPRLGPRLIGLGTGASLAVVGGQADPAVVARGVARDVAIWDQAGCLSPQELVVVGTRRDGHAMAEALAAELERIEPMLPAGALPLAGAALRRGFLAELAARGVAGEALTVWRPSDESDRWMVWLDDDPVFAMAPVRRHVAVRHVPSIEALIATGLPPAAHRQAVGLDPGDPFCGELAAALHGAGVPVILPLGSMQSPPVDWPNKGRDLLAELMGN